MAWLSYMSKNFTRKRLGWPAVPDVKPLPFTTVFSLSGAIDENFTVVGEPTMCSFAILIATTYVPLLCVLQCNR